MIRESLYKVLREYLEEDTIPLSDTDDNEENATERQSDEDILTNISESIDEMLKDIDNINDGELDSIRTHLEEAKTEISEYLEQ